MVQQTLFLGTISNDGTGTKAKPGGAIINDNFTELYSQFGKLPVNPQSGTSYTLQTTDNGKLVRCTNAGAVTVTIDLNATETIDAEAIMHIMATGGGAVTIEAETGVLLNGIDGGSVVIDGQYILASVHQMDVDDWSAIGKFV